jgi:pyrimidine operon attenuation protein/uracil phosphoribosyltransferase
VFVAHSQVLSAADVQRALTRMSHEVIERNGGLADVVVIGLQTGGVPLATRMAEIMCRVEGLDDFDVGTLDVAFYRDDIGLRPVLPEAVTEIPCDLADFVGKNLPTRREEMVDVGEDGVWIGTLEEK